MKYLFIFFTHFFSVGALDSSWGLILYLFYILQMPSPNVLLIIRLFLVQKILVCYDQIDQSFRITAFLS